MKTKKIINKAITDLVNSSNVINSNKWQAVNIEEGVKMIELNNLFLQMEICETIKELELETNADLPWAEDHFNERLSGATNPGEQYKKWPYYRASLDNERFRKDNYFSHTYQERFWPPKIKGIRYKMGDYLDVKKRLKKDKTTRQAFLSIWHPEDQSDNDVRLPCTIGYWFKINNNKLDVTYLIRSCDARRHFRNDMYMTQRLAIDILKYLNDNNISLGILSVWIGSFHCFESDLYTLKKQVK
jgi:thymidylate synthase